MTGRRDADIEQLIAEFERSGLRELHVRRDGLEIYLSADGGASGMDGVRREVTQVAPHESSPAVNAAPAAPIAQQVWPAGAVIVPAPYLGSFYRSPKPGSPPFVSLGDTVAADTELCLVEVMKLFTSVTAGTAGVVHAVLAQDGDMVSADQPLFVILPG